MAKKPLHPTINHMIQYYVNLYYVVLERDKRMREDIVTNCALVDKIAEDYWSELRRRYPDWDTEENRAYFKINMNWLTGCYTKYDNYEKLQANKADLLQKYEARKQEMDDFVKAEFKKFMADESVIDSIEEDKEATITSDIDISFDDF
jgi:hypothetical protein